MTAEQDLIAKASKPMAESLRLHQFYRGKMQTIPRCVVRSYEDFALWYSPGVAAPCQAIFEDKEKVYDLTNKWNTVAVVSDGTRVLGLGDIGPEAGMPVMEGKALLYKYLGGVDAVPICLDTKNTEEIIQAVKWLQPSFGGINLEDISSPKCFYILERLRAEMEIPVWHDDQQGTAAVTLAGLTNALKLVGKDKDNATVTLIGAGAANVAIGRLLFADGFRPENTIFVDSKGILHPERHDLEMDQGRNPYKWDLCLRTNGEKRTGGIAESLRGMDACVALSKPGPGTIRPEWLKTMAKDAIVFLCANPTPEAWPWEAKEVGCRVVATGRSDFPNQVNNSVGFPAIFRGVLDVRARTITDEMCVAAAHELAKCAVDRGIHEDYIMPTMAEWDIFARVAVAVATKAIDQGVARLALTPDELFAHAQQMIRESRDSLELLMREGIVPEVPR
jgi:malate dehydrogenase (oxaloacetate-decarboxylating)